jgi:hypothetical protein
MIDDGQQQWSIDGVSQSSLTPVPLPFRVVAELGAKAEETGLEVLASAGEPGA